MVHRFRGAFLLPHSRFCPGEAAESRRGRLQTAAGGAPGTIRLVVDAHAGSPCPTRTLGILYKLFFARPRGASPNYTDIICCFWPVQEEYYSTFTRCVEFLIFFFVLPFLARSSNGRKILLYTHNPREGGRRRRQTRRYDNLYLLLAPFCDSYADCSPTPPPRATTIHAMSLARLYAGFLISVA